MKTKLTSLLVLASVTFPMVTLAQWNVANLTTFGLPEGTVLGIVGAIVNWILLILGMVGVIGFVIAGIIYLLSAGSDTGTQKAKSAMVACILGVVVALAGLVIIQAVDTALTGSSTF
jgi:hypothetical protein